ERNPIVDPPGHEPAGVQIAPLRLRDERLREDPQLLGLRQRGLHAAVEEERGRHVAEHHGAVLRGPREMTSLLPVSHSSLPLLVPGRRQLLLRGPLGLLLLQEIELAVRTFLEAHPEVEVVLVEELPNLLERLYPKV